MTDSNLEKKVQETPKKLSFGEKVFDGVRSVPPILGCTAVTYLLNFYSCVPIASKSMQNGLNIDSHLAMGAGLYGGYTSKAQRKITTLCLLAASFAPETINLINGGDLNNASTTAGIKLLGYGLGYVVTRLVCSEK